jgi:plastocyanin domain-containing protein
VQVRAWDVDFSRREKDLKSMRLPASVVDEPQKPKDENIFSGFFEAVSPTQEIVIMNTDKGFIPETVRLKKGQQYKLFIVNVNGKEKNSSFILDAFSEHHATYFGEQKEFTISPKTDGIFSFQCPETAKQGRIIVYTDDNKNDKQNSSLETTRLPASE